MDDQKIFDLIEALLEQTTQSSISWRESSFDGDFILSLGEDTLVLAKWNSSSGEVFKLTIRNSMGKEIYSIQPGTFEAGYLTLSSLYEAVHYEVYNVGGTIDNLLEKLKKK